MIEAKMHLLGRDVARVAEGGPTKGAGDGKPDLQRRLPEREPAHRESAPGRVFARLRRGCRAIAGERLRLQAGVEEGHGAVRPHAAERIAAVGAGPAGEEPSQIDQLQIANPRRPVDPALRGHLRGPRGAPVVQRKEEPDGPARHQRDLLPEGEIAPHLGLDPHVERVPANPCHLHVVLRVEALVGPERIVAEIEPGEQIDEGDEEPAQIPVERARVGERLIELEAVRRRHEQPPESPLQPERALVFQVAEHGRLRVHLGRQQDGIHVELLADDAARPGLQKPRLAESRDEPLLGEDRRGRLEIGEPRGIEIEPRTEVDGEMPEPAEQVLVLPPHMKVGVHADRVQLEPAPDEHRLELLPLEAHDDRHDSPRRRHLRELGEDLRRAERPQIEHRPLRRLQGGSRIGLVRVDVESPPDRSLGEVAKPLDADRPEDSLRARPDCERERGRVRREVDVRAPLDLRPRVAAVRERAPHQALRAEKGQLLEALPLREDPRHDLAERLHFLPGEPLCPFDSHRADDDGRPLLHIDGDLDVLGVLVVYAPGADARLVEPARRVIALHPREIALEYALIVELVVVQEPAHDLEELGARRRRHLLLDFVAGDSLVPLHVDGVDGGGAARHRSAGRAAEGQRQERARARLHRGGSFESQSRTQGDIRP